MFGAREHGRPCSPVPKASLGYRCLLLTLSCVIALLAPALAFANVERIADGNDTPGPLDIAVAVQGHAADGSILAKVRMWAPFASSTLRGRNLVSFAFYREGYPLRWLYVSKRGTRLIGEMHREDGSVLGVAAVSRPDRRTVAVVVPTVLLGGPSGYEWAVFTAVHAAGGCSTTCIDAAPSSFQWAQTATSIVEPRLHDLTAPTVAMRSFPDPSTKSSATLAYPVRFAVHDSGGAGVRRWWLERRRLGEARWTVEAHGPRAGRHFVRLHGQEGRTYEHRIVAVDRQSNRRRGSVARVSVPIDEANPDLGPGYAGDWTFESTKSDFQHTLHSTSDSSATFAYAFAGKYVALIAPESDGTASVSIDGAPSAPVDLSSFAGHRKVVYEAEVATGNHTVVVGVATGLVRIDGVVVHGQPAKSVARSPMEPVGTRAVQVSRMQASDEVGLDCAVPEERAPLCQAEPRELLRFGYADGWQGWPVRPLHKQHPLISSFLDARPAGFHFGIDIAVRDDRPEPGAPKGRTHRVYAIEGGTAYNVYDSDALSCRERRIWIGHFAYYHVDAVVAPGQHVSAGQMIGWTCTGEWHVHLSELTSGHVLVDPLHPGRKLAPYSDSRAPIIYPFAFTRPAPMLWSTPHGSMRSPATGVPLAPDALTGTVDVRVRVSDPHSFHGWLARFPYLEMPLHPYRESLAVIRASDGATLMRREVSGPVFPYAEPLENHFAPGATANQRVVVCNTFHRSGKLLVPCRGKYWLHAFGTSSSPYWDTRSVGNGWYFLRVTAWDATGNSATRAVEVRVRNS